MNCKQCDYDFNKTITDWWVTLLKEYIECPECRSKFEVVYDEYYDPITEEERQLLVPGKCIKTKFLKLFVFFFV
jgi:DNA-directed RNA polymerase subunit RPC12/RpoP